MKYTLPKQMGYTLSQQKQIWSREGLQTIKGEQRRDTIEQEDFRTSKSSQL